MMRAPGGLLLAALGVAGQISSPSNISLRQGQTFQFAGKCPRGHECRFELAPGHDSTSRITAEGLYTAPAKAHRHGTLGGCPVQPHNSIFNTKISSLPVAPNSDAMVAQIDSTAVVIGTLHYSGFAVVNPVTASTPTMRMQAFYEKAWAGDYPLRSPPYVTVGTRDDPKARVQVGWRTTGIDNRWMGVNKDDCTVYEYYFGTPPEKYRVESPMTHDWANVVSMAAYKSMEPLNAKGLKNAVGTSVAAGMWLAPMQIDQTDLMRAVDRDGANANLGHAIGFTIPNVNIVAYAAGVYLWPAINHAGGAPRGLTPYGTRFRLKQSFIDHYNFEAAASAQPAADRKRVENAIRAIFNTVRDYGVIVMDGTYPLDSGAMHARTDGAYDPDFAAAMYALLYSKIKGWGNSLAALEAVDESSLMVAQGSNMVHAPIAEPELVAFRDMTTNNVLDTRDVVVYPPAIGTTRAQFNIVAGAGAVNLGSQVWATGLADNRAIQWTVLPKGVGTLSAAGIYTPPARLAAAQTLRVRAAAAEDPSVYVDLRVVLYPPVGRGLYIRSSSAKQANVVDEQGRTWWGLDPEKIQLNPFGLNSGPGSVFPIAPVDAAYPAAVYKGGAGSEQVASFYVPNGRYKVTTLAANLNAGKLSQYKTAIDLNGRQVMEATSLYDLGGAYNTGVHVSQKVDVTNGELIYGWRDEGPFNTGGYPFLAAIVIEPE